MLLSTHWLGQVTHISIRGKVTYVNETSESDIISHREILKVVFCHPTEYEKRRRDGPEGRVERQGLGGRFRGNSTAGAGLSGRPKIGVEREALHCRLRQLYPAIDGAWEVVVGQVYIGMVEVEATVVVDGSELWMSYCKIYMPWNRYIRS